MTMTRRTLMITEKSSQMRDILPHWQERFPNDDITHFHTPPIGSFRFRLPRNLPISKIPIIADPILERIPDENPTTGGSSMFDGDFGAMAREADHIVCATYFDAAGCRNFLDLMTQYGIKTPLSEISWLALNAQDPSSVRNAIKRGLRADHPDLARMASLGQARQYFNNLYLLNALPVFGLALKAVGIAPVGKFNFLSKYTLQLLLLLSRTDYGPLHHGEIVKLMLMKQASSAGSPLGSPMSREAVVSWLEQSGCLAHQGAQGDKRFTLSDRGKRLADLIHKDCFDTHLSARLEGWGKAWPASKPAIDRYIKSFFGKQKRFLLGKIHEPISNL